MLGLWIYIYYNVINNIYLSKYIEKEVGVVKEGGKRGEKAGRMRGECGENAGRKLNLSFIFY